MMGYLARFLGSVREKLPWRKVWLAARLLVSVGLVVWLALTFDWRATWQAMSTISLGGLVALVLGLLLNRLIAFYRFWVLLRREGAAIDLGTVLRISFLAVFAGNFLPTTVGGDLAKIGWLAALSRRPGGSAGMPTRLTLLRMAFWTLFDRLSNMLAVGLLAPFCLLLPLVQEASARGLGGRKPDLLFAWLVFGGLCLVAGLALGAGRGRASQPPGETAPVEQPEAGRLKKVRDWWLTLLARRRLFGLLALLSFLSIAPNLLATWLAARELGMNVALWGVTAVYVVLYFVTLLPVSINGLGLQEVSTIALYGSLGATAPQAAALAILLRFAIWVTTLPGAIWLGRGVASAAASTPGLGAGQDVMEAVERSEWDIRQ